MMISIAFSSWMLRASFSAQTLLPIAGPSPPICDVVKNTGSIWSKSPSCCMRCISTEPTIPRQPTKPTRLISIPLNPVNGKGEIGNKKSLPCSSGSVHPEPISNSPLPVHHSRVQCRHHRITHFFSADFFRPGLVYVGRTQTLLEHALDRGLDTRSGALLGKAVTQHHSGRQYGGQRIRNVAPGDVGCGAVDRF